MLPAAAVFHFPWEVNSGAVQEGESVRVLGRLVFTTVLIHNIIYLVCYFDTITIVLYENINSAGSSI